MIVILGHSALGTSRRPAAKLDTLEYIVAQSPNRVCYHALAKPVSGKRRTVGSAGELPHRPLEKGRDRPLFRDGTTDIRFVAAAEDIEAVLALVTHRPSPSKA
jgi:hypothetical protein